MRFFERIALALFVATIPAKASTSGASFDCSKARQLDEIEVCSNVQLSQLDRIAHAAFMQAQLNSLDAHTVIEIAREFQKKRKLCVSNELCIKETYIEVINNYKNIGASVEMPSWAAAEHKESITSPASGFPRDSRQKSSAPDISTLNSSTTAQPTVRPPSTLSNNAQRWTPSPSEPSSRPQPAALPPSAPSNGSPEGVIGIIIFGLIIYISLAINRSVQAEKFINGFIESQAAVFARRKSQLVFLDDYGIENVSKWEKDKKHIVSVVIPSRLAEARLSKGVENLVLRDKSKLLRKIEAAASNCVVEAPRAVRSMQESGVEYERQCAEILQAAGWSARLTKGSGDQGVDIIAEGFNKRVVVQCKLYSKPVGNKAVQEVIGAREYEKADAAVVVSNADYTPSARRLASTAKVLLMHHDELSVLEQKI